MVQFVIDNLRICLLLLFLRGLGEITSDYLRFTEYTQIDLLYVFFLFRVFFVFHAIAQLASRSFLS